MGGSWLPVGNTTAASKSGEVYWPVAIRGHELCSIMCPKQQPYPSVCVRACVCVCMYYVFRLCVGCVFVPATVGGT